MMYLCSILALTVLGQGLVEATSPTHGIKLDARGYEVTKSDLARRDLPVGTCNAQTPCVNGACCGSDNLCGYSPKQCGTGCRFNCDAKAECGPYAPDGKQGCPLNVCCSEFGFCGSTSEFCTWTNKDDPNYPTCSTKYGGCGDVKRPSCGSGTSVSKRTIGYYETWANSRKKSPVAPEDLNLDGFTHINFAFSFFDASSFEITSMDSNAASLYSRFTALKGKKDGLQAWISVGGWSFTDPGPTQKAFSNMVSSQGNRAKFIGNLRQFMDTYGFDGVDLDWEYPGADDRGGVSADTENYVALAKEMRASFGNKYGMSMTLPTSYWYLQHFDLPGIQDSLDWFNLMAYDLHGTWDKASKFVGPYIAPHTNITEIDLGMDLLWRAGVHADKVVLGQGWYGRSFTLADPSCNVPNGKCQFSDAAKPGPISNAAGILIDTEINDIIKSNNLQPTWDKQAGVKWVCTTIIPLFTQGYFFVLFIYLVFFFFFLCMKLTNHFIQITWDSNQWVSYDDSDTFKQKRDFANSRCLGGLMVWAMDQVDQTAPNGLNPGGTDVTSDQQSDASQLSDNQAAQMTCKASECGESCPAGSNAVTQVNGNPGSLSTKDRCKKGKYRSICCQGGTTMGTCQWRGFRGHGLSCIGGCADGETEVATNTNSHEGKTDHTCNGGKQSYCCKGFKPKYSKAQLEKDAKEAAKEAAEAAAEQAALDIAAKAFCRVAVPALLAPLELLEDLIPIIGEILDIAEVAATPALIQACVKGVEKEGKAEFKVFGKKHTLSFNKPTEKPTATRPPMSSHEPPKTKTDDSCPNNRKRNDCDRPERGDVTSYNKGTTTLYITSTKVCDGGAWPQACMHYSSAIRQNPGRGFNPVTCSEETRPRVFNGAGPALNQWNAQHNKEWKKWMRRAAVGSGPGQGCERDEWPPAHFWQGRAGQIVRYNHRSDNSGAGQLWRGFCPEKALYRCVPGTENIEKPPRGRTTTHCKKELTLKGLFSSHSVLFCHLLSTKHETN